VKFGASLRCNDIAEAQGWMRQLENNSKLQRRKMSLALESHNGQKCSNGMITWEIETKRNPTVGEILGGKEALWKKQYYKFTLRYEV
jgi:hypothetical protein